MTLDDIKRRPADELFRSRPLEWIRWYGGRDFDDLSIQATHIAESPIYLQGNGLRIVLNSNGFYSLEDTTGG